MPPNAHASSVIWAHNALSIWAILEKNSLKVKLFDKFRTYFMYSQDFWAFKTVLGYLLQKTQFFLFMLTWIRSTVLLLRFLEIKHLFWTRPLSPYWKQIQKYLLNKSTTKKSTFQLYQIMRHPSTLAEQRTAP